MASEALSSVGESESCMALRINKTYEQGIASSTAIELIQRALKEHGRVSVFVPSYREGLDLQRKLANENLSLGISVQTPEAWAGDRWALWGDGQSIVSPIAATILMRDALAHDEHQLALPGTVRLLCSLARQALPWLLTCELDGKEGVLTQGLSASEHEVLLALIAYKDRLRSLGLIEESELMVNLPDVLKAADVTSEAVVAVGFTSLSRARRELFVGLAELGELNLVTCDETGPFCDLASQMLTSLTELAQQKGVVVTTQDAELRRAEAHSGELDQLLSALFSVDPSASVRATGKLRLLEAAGPLAEAELIARAVKRCAEEGAKDIVVVSPDTSRMWRELTPKLTARGCAVSAHVSIPFSETETGKAFSTFIRGVSQLCELQRTWPCEENNQRRVGDMSWWPPRDISDFLLSGLSQLEQEKAIRLDSAWRSNRLLSPADVLSSLLSAKLTSEQVERATRELLRGRIGSAASRLMADSVEALDDVDAGRDVAVRYASLEKTSALAAILEIASTLRELGITYDPKASGPYSLTQLVECTLLALETTTLVMRPELTPANACCRVRMVSPAQAARMPPASATAVIVCGLSSDEWPLTSQGSLADALLTAMNIDHPPNEAARTRASFSSILAVAQQSLLLERTLFTATSHERFPSPLLRELLACYAKHMPPIETLGEETIVSNMAHEGLKPAPKTVEHRAASGCIDQALRELVIVPPEGVPLRPGDLPLLSASQIESYLECPLKWFSLRRLKLQDVDAGCGALEMGSFVHRVLELTRRSMLIEGLSGLEEPDATILANLATGTPLSASPHAYADDTIASALKRRVRSSRVLSDDDESLIHATRLLDMAFDEHLAHQFETEGGHARMQALIAHTARERDGIARLRYDLSTTLSFESSRLLGFEPRFFEWDFGGKRDIVTYAGARIVGTVDRIDVNAHGQAIVIDYKHKNSAGFVSEHGVFDKGGYVSGEAFVLPRRVQALIYGQVVRRAFPSLRVVGSLYLGTRGDHALAGAASAQQAQNIFGDDASSSVLECSAVPSDASFGRQDTAGMDALLDTVESTIAERLDEMRAGNVDARPIDELACRYCPVLACERRLS